MNMKNVDVQQDSETSAGPKITLSQNHAVDPPAPKIKRYLSLDHWRGIACLLVVINHATLPLCGDPVVAHEQRIVRSAESEREPVSPAPRKLDPLGRFSKLLVFLTTRMHFGVEMFFVISGYCITASAQSLKRSGYKISEYFRRRFVRIYPPFWCALFCSATACFAIDRIYPGLLVMSPWPLPVPWELSPWQWFGCLTLTGTWIGYFTGEQRLCFPIQSWTLCYEEQFYAVMGVLLACSGRRFFRAATFVTIAAFAVVVASIRFQIPVRGFFFDEHWFMFAAGVGVYWCLHLATSRQSAIYQMTLLGSIVGLLVLARATSLFGQGSQFSALRVVGALGFAQLLIWLKRYDERIDSVKSLNCLKSCGVMCYSIYLIHLFPGKLISQTLLIFGYTSDASILLICIPLALAVSVSLGYLFHVTVERRFMISHHEIKIPQQGNGSRPNPPAVVAIPDHVVSTLSFQEWTALMARRTSLEDRNDSPRRKVA